MKRICRLLLLLALCALLLGALGGAAWAESMGWHEDSVGRYYVDADGSRHEGWLLDGDTWYYLNPYLITDRLMSFDGETWYYFGVDGAMAANGWADRTYTEDGETYHERYFAHPGGTLAMGWLKINFDWYYFEPAMVAGGPVSFDDGQTYYYFRDDGTMADDGWQEARWGSDPEDAAWYYAEPGGSLAQGWKQIDGEWYYLTPARADHGAATFDGGSTWYFFYDDGRMAHGERVYERYTYYGETTENWYIAADSGKLYTGWKAEGGYWYYYGPWMYKDGTAEINGKSYTFDASGRWTGGTAPRPGWNKQDGKWYYYDENMTRLTYWQQIGGKWYYFNGSGVMQTGWVQSGGNWYSFDASGAMRTGWQKLGGSWYYLGSDGVMRSYWQQIGGSWYYFSGSGVMQTGWLKSGGYWYYLDENGAMLTNTTRSIDGKACRFDASGRWQP